jgi:hypothetical protein
MALERKDVRFKLDAHLHTLLVAVSTDADQCDIGEWCEMVVQRELLRRAHAATVIAEAAARAGISGSAGESSGREGRA